MRAGIRTPARPHRNGRSSGGAAFSRGRLYNLLANPLFIGRIRHRGQVHPGQHPAIVDEALWQAVQDRLAANRQNRTTQRTAETPSPLAGRLLDPDGRKMRPSHASRKGRRYRYYVSAELIEGSVATGATGWRMPAPEIEAAVGSAVAARLREPGFLSEVLRFSQSAPEASTRLIGRISELADRLDAPASAAGREAMQLLITRVELSRSELRAEVSLERLNETMDEPSVAAPLSDFPPFIVVAPLQLQRRGPELRIVLQGAAAPVPKPDPRLRADLDRGANVDRRLSRSGSGPDGQRHRPARGRECRRCLALAAARLPCSRSGRGHPRWHPAGRPHRRATEACRRTAVALGRAARDGSVSTNLEDGALRRLSGAYSEARRGELAVSKRTGRLPGSPKLRAPALLITLVAGLNLAPFQQSRGIRRYTRGGLAGGSNDCRSHRPTTGFGVLSSYRHRSKGYRTVLRFCRPAVRFGEAKASVASGAYQTASVFRQGRSPPPLRPCRDGRLPSLTRGQALPRGVQPRGQPLEEAIGPWPRRARRSFQRTRRAARASAFSLLGK